MSKKRMISIGFLSAAVLFGLGFGLKLSQPSSHAAAKFSPYTIVWRVVEQDAEGSAKIVYTQTRYKSSDGRWLDIKLYPDGTTDETFSEPGRGVFKIGNEKLYFLSQAQAEPRKSKLEDFVNSPQYLRTETVQGLSTVVLHTGIGDIYVSPDLDCDWIKAELPGDAGKTVWEPIAIALGEPRAASLEHKELPTSYESLHQVHETDKMKDLK